MLKGKLRKRKRRCKLDWPYIEKQNGFTNQLYLLIVCSSGKNEKASFCYKNCLFDLLSWTEIMRTVTTSNILYAIYVPSKFK